MLAAISYLALVFALISVASSVDIETLALQVCKSFLSTPTFWNAFDNSGNSYKPVLIVPISELGLGNRLRILSSAYHLATESGRRLVVIWTPSVGCFAKFHDLFSINASILSPNNEIPDLAVIDVSLDDLGSIPDEKYATSLLYRSLQLFVDMIHVDTKIFTAYNTDSFLLQPDFYHDANKAIIVLWTRLTASFSNSSCEQYSKNRARVYQSLVPSESVREILNIFVAELDRAKLRLQGILASTEGGDSRIVSDGALPEIVSVVRVIGVHIRAYDADFDWPVVAPDVNDVIPEHQEGDQSTQGKFSGHVRARAMGFHEISPTEAFVPLITTLLAENNDTVVFIASNSDDLKLSLLHSFGTRAIGLVTYDANSRASVSGMVLAAAEFLVLSQYCDGIIHSKGSSFALEASVAFGLPVVDVRPVVVAVVIVVIAVVLHFAVVIVVIAVIAVLLLLLLILC